MKNFIQAINEMLMKCDVNALKEFVHERTDFYEKEYIKWFDSNSQLHEWTLHKMIVATEGMPKELREKSEKWLEEN